MPTAARPARADIAALTPADRNRYADLLRVAAIVVVVLGHWLLAVVTVRDGRLEGANLLALVPATQWLTWVFQVMPVFFFVGGYANAAAWTRARRPGDGYADWVRARAARLLRPTVPVLALWVPLTAALAVVGVPAGTLRLGTQLVVVPMWFLAVYIVVVALVPVTWAAHSRFGLTALAALGTAAVAADVAHLAGVPMVGWTNLLWVWAGVHQLGYLWFDGRLTRRACTAWWLGPVGFGLLAALVVWAGYPVSMVGVDGAVRSNNSPPSVALLALGIGQVGLILVARDRVERWLQRPAVWARVVGAGAVTMTLYLWHLTAMVAVAAALYATGLWPSTNAVDARWWALRPVWFALLGLAMVALVRVFGRFERAAPPRPAPAGRGRIAATVGGVAACGAGLGLLILGGLHTPGWPGGVPAAPLGLVLAGLALLGVLPADGLSGRRPTLPQPR